MVKALFDTNILIDHLYAILIRQPVRLPCRLPIDLSL